MTETWLSPSRAQDGSLHVSIPGFQPPFRCDRRGNRLCGGVAIYVRNGLIASPVAFSKELEALCVELHLPGKRKAFVAVVYRPPARGASLSDFVHRLDSALVSLHS